MAYDRLEIAYDKVQMLYERPAIVYDRLEVTYDKVEMVYDTRQMAYVLLLTGGRRGSVPAIGIAPACRVNERKDDIKKSLMKLMRTYIRLFQKLVYAIYRFFLIISKGYRKNGIG